MNCFRGKPIRAAISAVVLLLCACVPAAALDASQLPKPAGYVSDFARVLDASALAQIESYCATVEQSTGAQIAVVTLSSLEGEPIEDFTNNLFRRWGIGQKGKNEGVMLLLAIRDRKSRVEVGYGLEPVMPDGFVGSVLREMAPSLKEGNYGQAVLAGTAEIGDQVAKAKNVTLTRTIARRAPPTEAPAGTGVPWTLILIVVVLLFGLLGRGGGGGGGLFSWLLLGSMMGGSRYGGGGGGGWGGGGFGGSSGGGGGFGGFGGGDAGGGGASGSW